MLRLAGALLLTAGGAALGMAACAHLGERVACLRAVVGALELMERELTFSLTPMPELLAGLARRGAPPVRPFFAQCARELDELNGHTLCQIWQEAAAAHLGVLSGEDLAILLPLGAVLGRYGGEDQRLAVAQAADGLRRQLDCAVVEQRRQRRVYGTLGVSAGAFLVIILL